MLRIITLWITVSNTHHHSGLLRLPVKRVCVGFFFVCTDSSESGRVTRMFHSFWVICSAAVSEGWLSRDGLRGWVSEYADKSMLKVFSTSQYTLDFICLLSYLTEKKLCMCLEVHVKAFSRLMKRAAVLLWTTVTYWKESTGKDSALVLDVNETELNE